MKASSFLAHLCAGLLCMSLSPSVQAAPTQFNLTTPTPRIVSLQTTLNPTGGPVAVDIRVTYNPAGKPSATATVEGAPVACVVAIPSFVANPTCRFTLTRPTAPRLALTISGVFTNSTAVCAYNGPRGRTNIAAQAVSIAATQPVAHVVTLSPSVTAKGVIAGNGRVQTGYGTNFPIAGKLTGKVTTNLLTWALWRGRECLRHRRRTRPVSAGFRG